MAAPRGISQPPTSFIGSQCQGIHHAPLNTYNTKPKNESSEKICITPNNNPHQHTHPPQKTGANPFAQAVIQMLATTIHKSNTTPHHQSRAATRTPNTPAAGKHSTTEPSEAGTHPHSGMSPQACCLRTQQCVWQSFRRPDSRRTEHVCCAPEPHPLQAQPLITNRSEPPNPHTMWAASKSRGAP